MEACMYQPAPSTASLRAVRAGGDGTALFLLPDAAGGVDYIAPLLAHLPHHMTVYALDLQNPEPDVHLVARQCLDAMRKVRPCGPYNLLGWGDGGVLAHELGNLLIGCDERVNFLGMIVTRGPLVPTGLDLPPPDDPFGVRYYAWPASPVPLNLFVPRGDTLNAWGWSSTRHRVQARAVDGLAMPFSVSAWAQLGAVVAEAIADPVHRREIYEEHFYSPHVLIQSGQKDATPVFLVPGAGASITSFVQLAQALGPAWPMHGLQPRGLCGEMLPHTDIESAARCYVRAIRALTPNGRCHLVGHSYGGWNVLEIARQLGEQGVTVGAVIALDSRAPTGPGQLQKRYARAEALEWLVRLYDRNLKQPIGLRADDFRPLAPAAQIGLLLSRLIAHKVLPERTSPQMLMGVVSVFLSNINTAYRSCAPLSGTTQLVIAEEEVTDAGELEACLNAWRVTVPQLELKLVAGNHLTLLSGANVQSLAAWLGEMLERHDEAVVWAAQ